MATRKKSAATPTPSDLMIQETHEAERALLGCVLWSTETAERALEMIGVMAPEWFYREGHREIWRQMMALRAEGKADAINAVTIVGRMAIANTLPLIESGLYLVRLAADCPTMESAGHYGVTVRAYARERGIKTAMKHAALVAQVDTAAAQRALDGDLAGLPGADADTGSIPLGYHIGTDGALWRSDGPPLSDTVKGRPALRICPCVPRITRRGVDVGSGEHQLTIGWTMHGISQTYTCSRGVVSSSRTIVSLADRGLPVTSNTASEMVDYFQTADELSTIIPIRMSRVCGWHGNSFLRGSNRHGDDCPEWMRGDGVDAVIDSVGEAGEFQQWSDTMLDTVTRFPVIRMLVATAAAPPLIRLVNSPMWAVDICGDAGGGKSTAARVATSMWGNPEKYQQEWGATRVAIERICEALSDMPVFLDDTRRAPTPDFPSKAVFDIVSSRGKSRGSLKGMQRQAVFRTVLMSTGEGPMTSGELGSGGSRRRSVVLSVPPWGGRSTEIGGEARRIEGVCKMNYGHAGRMLIDKLVAMTDDDRAAMKARWHEFQSYYCAKLACLVADKTAPVDAAAQYLATTRLAGETLAEAVGWPEMEWVDRSLLRRVAFSIAQVDRARAALVYALDWFSANPARVMGRESSSMSGTMLPGAGYIGLDTKGRFCFVTTVLEAELKRAGFDAEAVMSAWQDRKWTVRDPQRRTKRHAYAVPGGQPHTYHLIEIAEAIVDEVSEALNAEDKEILDDTMPGD